MPEADENAKPPQKRRKRRWPYVLGGLFLVLVIALVWLNGPGIRWLAPKIGGHFMGKAGITGSFRLEGSITGGISIHDVDLSSAGTLEKLTLVRATPLYEFSKVIKGEVIGISLEGLHADIRLGVEKEETPKEPLNLEELVKTIRQARDQVVPLKIDLRRISTNVREDGKLVFGLEPSDIVHEAGSADIALNLGKISAADGRDVPPQTAILVWDPERLGLDKLDPYPGIGIRDLSLDLPATGEPAARTQVLVDEATFEVQTAPGFKAATLDLRSGALQVDRTAKSFGVEIPAIARLSSLSVSVDGILPDPLAATGEVQLALEGVKYEDWEASEVTLGTTLASEQATVALRVNALQTVTSLDVAVPVSRAGAKFTLGEAVGTFGVADVPKLVEELARRFEAIDPSAEVPASTLAGNFKVAFTDANVPRVAEADILLKPADETVVSPLAIKGRWEGNLPATAEVTLDGLKVNGRYEIETKRYQGTLELADFTNRRIDRWLAIGRIDAGGEAKVSGRWSGSGDLVGGTHRGDLALARAEWLQPEKPPIQAAGNFDYEWPGKVNATGLRVETQDQTISLDLGLADNRVEMKQLLWKAGSEELAAGSAALPVPEDFSKWREMLANDKRPLKVSIESRVLSLERLKPWLPAAAQLDPRSTGQLKIQVAGNYGAPEIDLALDCLNLRSPAQPKLPPADLRIKLNARDGRMALDGTATAPDFAPAVITASLPFRPAEWAEKPELVMDEPLSARVDLPRLDISRFASLVPVAKQVTGVLTGNVQVGGKVGKPEIRGEINLANGGLVFTDQDLPAIREVAMAAEATIDRISLKSLTARVAGGSARVEGSLTLVDGKPGTLDFRVTGDHLPLVRNDLMIVRANAALRLQGPWETAALTGSVGIVDSLAYRDIELIPIGTSSGPAAAELPKIDAPANPAAGVPAPFSNWGVNVNIRTEDPILIRGNLGTGQVEVALKVGGTIGNPAPDGTAIIRDGKAALPFSTLQVPRGTVRFTPATGFDPILEIRGLAEPRPYRVEIYVYGNVSNPQLVLTSNPPLPEHEIMTLLATGTTTSGLEDTQAASSRAFQLLIEEARRGRLPFARQLRPVLKVLDRVDFNLAEADPYDADSFSTATIKLDDRWYVSAGMGSNGDSRFLGIWRLSFR